MSNSGLAQGVMTGENHERSSKHRDWVFIVKGKKTAIKKKGGAGVSKVIHKGQGGRRLRTEPW